MNNILMLRSTKWLDRHEIENDFYCMLVKHMVDIGSFKYGEVWIQDKNGPDKILFDLDNFKVKRFNHISDVTIDIDPDVLYVRGAGGAGEYLPIIQQCKKAIKIYWSGNIKNVPELDIYDIVLVADETSKDKIKNSIVKRLIKGVVSNVFKPINVEKIYDFCYVANVNRPVKNHKLLIEALSRIVEPLNIIYVGDVEYGNRSDEEYVNEVISSSEKNIHNVIFAGVKDKESINIIMNQSKFGVICSEAEDSPRVISEYLAAGIPVLCNKNLVDHEFYINNDTGIAVYPEDFEKGIKYMLDMYKTYHPFNFFNNNLTIPKIANSLYNTILTASRGKV